MTIVAHVQSQTKYLEKDRESSHEDPAKLDRTEKVWYLLRVF